MLSQHFSLQARGNAGLVPSLARPFLLAANGLGDKLTDLACDVVPSTIERGTVRLPFHCFLDCQGPASMCNQACILSQVEIAVKAGLVLAAVSIARSLLGVGQVLRFST